MLEPAITQIIQQMESAALARAKELKHPLGPSDLCVGHTKLPDCPLIQFMVHHGVDHCSVATPLQAKPS